MAKKLQPTLSKMLQVERAFYDHGYSELSMRGLAKACDLSTRALYYYFSSKEEAFRATCRFRNELALNTCFAAARRRWDEGGDALDIIAELINIRYGDTRRMANASQHLVELNAETFKRCNDIITEVALHFEAALAKFIIEMEEGGLLQLRADATPEQLAQALANGARGVNQRLPPAAPDALASCYREICCFVLFGGAEIAAANQPPRRQAPKRAGDPRS
ncbi:MAG TPA: helix-turn-helix domain-containing protein [Roseiarcus sp.]|nr:helix-turn-helix domain-containing protein [Roseiarcus sp.]